MTRPTDLARLRKLKQVTSLAKNVAIARLSSAIQAEDRLRAAVENLPLHLDEAEWCGSDGARSQLHKSWTERQKIALNIERARLRSEIAQLRLRAAKATGKDAVVNKLVDRM